MNTVKVIVAINFQRKVVFNSVIILMSIIGPNNKKDKIEPVVKFRT